MVFVFGDHELDEAQFQLRRAGRAIVLQPKVLALLLYLVRNRDRVVSKDELLEAVWSDATVTDNSLARAVSLARQVIGDRDRAPRAILTVPRRGYRFQAVVSEAASGSPPDGHDDSVSNYVGRESLLERLGARLDAALRGRGGILVLVGEAGIGKTRTAAILATRARQRGATVSAALGLAARASTYSPWTRILRELALATPTATASLTPAQRSVLARLLPELDSGQPEPGRPASIRDDARVLLFEAVLVFLTHAARERAIALFFDDLHCADAESVSMLEFIGQAVGTLPLAVVVTCREDDTTITPRRARALEALMRLGSIDRWPLVGLGKRELHAFVSAWVAGDPDPDLVDVLERKSGGNPLLLVESLRSLEARGLLRERRGKDAWEALLPQGVLHLLRPRLQSLSEHATAILGCASAIGVEVDRRVLGRAMSDGADFDARLRELQATGLLLSTAYESAWLRFAHPLVRDALYQSLVPPGEERRILHSRIAAVLEEGASLGGDALADRAHHACEGAPLVDPRLAALRAQAAGEQAAALHDFECAAAWHGRALAAIELDRATEPALRAALCLGLGAAQVRTVGLERARGAFRQAADHARSIGRGDLLALAALGFAHRPNASGHGDREVVEVLEEAVRAVSESEEALRIRLVSRLAAELRYEEPARAETLADGAVAAALRLGDTAVRAQALNDASYVRWSPADTHTWIALNGDVARAAHAANDLELVLGGQKGRATGFLELGDVAAVDREIRACEQTAETLRTPLAFWLCAALRAMRALLDGDLETAERRVAGSLLLGERLDSVEVALELYVQSVYLRLEQGRAGEIEATMRAQAQRFPDAPAWRAGLARLLIAMDRSSEARGELERLARQRFVDVPRDRGWLPTLAFAAEVANAVGDASSAEMLEPLLAPYAHLAVVAGSGLIYYGPVSHHLGLAAATRSRWDAAVGCFESALAAECRAGARVWEARTRIAWARALLSRDDRADRARAATLLGEALATARALGLADVAANARDLEVAIWSHRAGVRARSGSGPR